jgi:hypothetical protein
METMETMKTMEKSVPIRARDSRRMKRIRLSPTTIR